MFDMMLNCPLLRDHVAQGKVGFGINHEMRDFVNNKKKRLDLVICQPHASSKPQPKRSRILKRPIATFADVAMHQKLPLTPAESADLARLPELRIVPVGTVLVAIEAKAAMTEFSKAESRLFSELDSSITVINGHAQHAIAGALVMVNVADEFVSPIKNLQDFDTPPVFMSRHKNQPHPAIGVIETVRQVRRRTVDTDRGFDVLGILVVDLRNNGSPGVLVKSTPAPEPSDALSYDQMVTRAAALYSRRFSTI